MWQRRTRSAQVSGLIRLAVLIMRDRNRDMPDKLTVKIPYPGKPKARPRVTRTGHAFMPKDYMAWKDEIRAFVKQTCQAVHFDGPVKCEMVFHRDHIRFVIEKMEDDYQYVRGDIDNLAGGLMDAIQPAKGETGLYQNDSQVRELSARIARKGES